MYLLGYVAIICRIAAFILLLSMLSSLQQNRKTCPEGRWNHYKYPCSVKKSTDVSRRIPSDFSDLTFLPLPPPMPKWRDLSNENLSTCWANDCIAHKKQTSMSLLPQESGGKKQNKAAGIHSAIYVLSMTSVYCSSPVSMMPLDRSWLAFIPTQAIWKCNWNPQPQGDYWAQQSMKGRHYAHHYLAVSWP